METSLYAGMTSIGLVHYVGTKAQAWFFYEHVNNTEQWYCTRKDYPMPVLLKNKNYVVYPEKEIMREKRINDNLPTKREVREIARKARNKRYLCMN